MHTPTVVAIISHTPLWVWPLLAFLLYRGWQARATRELPILRALALPLVMLGLSLSGLVLGLGHHAGSAVLGAAALVLSAWLSYRSRAARAIQVDAVQHRLRQRGSWQPLLLTMGIFVVKYTAGALQGLHPELLAQPWFALPQAALYGAFAGIFAGKLLRIVQLYRQAHAQRGQAGVAAG